MPASIPDAFSLSFPPQTDHAMHTSQLLLGLTLTTAILSGLPNVTAAAPIDANALVQQIGNSQLMAMSIGRTSENQSITAIVHREALNLTGKKWRILLIADSTSGSQSLAQALRWFYQADAPHRFSDQWIVSAVPQISPGKASAETHAFPPAGTYYQSDRVVEHQYVWRWIGMHAPDLVVYVQPGNADREWYYPRQADAELVGQTKSQQGPGPGDALVDALVQHAPCGTGTVPAIRVTTQGPGNAEFLSELLKRLQQNFGRKPSAARQALQSRLDRTPREIATQLTASYGRKLQPISYIPTLACVGRIRLSELTRDTAHRQAVNRLVAPYLTGKIQPGTQNGSSVAGHLIFTELAKRTSPGKARERLLALARPAADLGFTSTGELRQVMPHHNEMSDAVFMSGPLLAAMGQLTGETKYFDMAIRHIRYMRQRCHRADGIYRHSPLNQTAWGRGNGFPALGLALCLSVWPEQRQDQAELVTMFREHMAALKGYQDATGCWHQIIDNSDSYREFTCTCMITFAMARGVSRGWLQRDLYAPHIRRAWPAIQSRIAANGSLVDVCTGTGKQRSAKAYHQRKAILGRDDRGGAMALMVCTEMAVYLPAAD